MIYRTDPTWWRNSHPRGETVVAGSPVRIFRLTRSASSFLDDLESGRDVDATTSSLQTRLVEAGAIHPMPQGDMPGSPTLADVTVVIPAHVHDVCSLHNLVTSLPDVADIVVIDDGSPTPLDDIPRARFIRNDTALGPGAARNVALREVRTDFVLFLDHDISIAPEGRFKDFWTPLLLHMCDSRVAIVAPRVRSKPGRSVLERYELENSPLDMGPHAALVAPGSRLTYVPSAALLVRMESLRGLHGFDETLRYGEDVDLVWRAHSEGLICRYEPIIELFHDPRPNWSALFKQRFHYGTAAADLEARHPGATRPLRSNRWSAVVVAVALSGHLIIASGIAVSSVVRLAERLRDLPDRWLLAWRLAGRGHVFAGRMTFEAASRTWWPITLMTCIVSKRLRYLMLIHVLVRSLVPTERSRLGRSRSGRSHGKRLEPLDPARSTLVKIGDDIAYGTGVWAGAIANKSFDCLTPRFD